MAQQTRLLIDTANGHHAAIGAFAAQVGAQGKRVARPQAGLLGVCGGDHRAGLVAKFGGAAHHTNVHEGGYVAADYRGGGVIPMVGLQWGGHEHSHRVDPVKIVYRGDGFFRDGQAPATSRGTGEAATMSTVGAVQYEWCLDF